jgi:hypothetical protein
MSTTHGKAVWGWGRCGVPKGRTLFPTQQPFKSRFEKCVPEKRPPPTTSSPTHLHDPSREPHPHASLSIRSIILLAGRDGAGSGAPVPTMCGQVRGTLAPPSITGNRHDSESCLPSNPQCGPASRPHCFSQPSNQITYTHLTSCLSREGRRAGLGPWGASLDSACLWYETGVFLQKLQATEQQPSTFQAGARYQNMRVFGWSKAVYSQ